VVVVEEVTEEIKKVILSGDLGNIISAEFQEYLDIEHGASYYRRWHGKSRFLGTLLCTKTSHHFDQMNWSIDASELEVKGGLNTSREIARQPLVWRKTYDLVYKRKEKIKIIFNFVTEQDNCNIIITGAGTSAFIGN